MLYIAIDFDCMNKYHHQLDRHCGAKMRQSNHDTQSRTYHTLILCMMATTHMVDLGKYKAATNGTERRYLAGHATALVLALCLSNNKQ